MQTSYNEIKNKIVQTVSGIKLGKVCNIQINTEEQFIIHYEVKTKVFSKDRLLISRGQIVRFENDKIIVDDNVKQEKTPVEKPSIEMTTEPIAMRESN